MIYGLISGSTDETFRELDFRCPSWSLTQELRDLTGLLKDLKGNIDILHKRNYLSITPKMEDIALVNRWIQNYNVKHFYLQVFFDKAYVISFRDILTLVSNGSNEGNNFSIERDVKNQGKTTIKINVQIGKELLGKIDMPEHKSAMKELERGRLLFYVTFEGGKGYLDNEIFIRDVINA
jgi:type II restriction enzyme